MGLLYLIIKNVCVVAVEFSPDSLGKSKCKLKYFLDNWSYIAGAEAPEAVFAMSGLAQSYCFSL
jgi:hypothetical protein